MQFNVDPSDVPDEAPTDLELRAVVRNLGNGCETGTTGKKAAHLREWLGDTKHEEEEDGVDRG